MSEAQWRALAAAALKGAGVDTLATRTLDAIPVEPLYPAGEGPRVFRAFRSPPQVAVRVDHPDPGDANALALADLEGGANALALVFDGAPGARGFGLSAEPRALDRALAGVELDLVALCLEGGRSNAAAAAEAMLDLAGRRGHGTLDLDLGLDPVGIEASSGTPGADEPLAALLARGIAVRVFRADGRIWHEAGASEAHELGAVLATGVHYLRRLERAGLDLDDARRAPAFRLAADCDVFLTIAKFRALRLLWDAVERGCGLAPRPIHLSAETAWRMLARQDPATNMLRATLAAFAAIVGGADAVLVLPHTAPHGLPDAPARRTARNLLHMLGEEAGIWRVADPAAGSGAFETLTAKLAEAGWAAFQQIEREGGIVASLRSGALPGRVAAAREERVRALAEGRAAIVGTTVHAPRDEAPPAVLAPMPASAAGRHGRLADAFEGTGA